MKRFTEEWLALGLVQFGSFQHEQGQAPIETQFEMLASYPQMLHTMASGLAEEAQTMLGQADFLLATHDSVALGVALALHTNIPLLYARHKHLKDIVGAYDVGHPALLVTHVYHPSMLNEAIVQAGSRQGADVIGVLCALNCAQAEARWPVVAWWSLDAVLDTYLSEQWITQAQAQAVIAWAEQD